MSMRSLLVTSRSGRKILIDTGAGYKHLKQLSFYRLFGQRNLRTVLQECYGVSPEEITDVVLTHLHFDHCGHCTYEQNGSLHISFPRASYWVGSRQWQNYCHPNILEKESYFADDMDLVEKCGLLSLLDTDEYLAPDVQLCLFDGHTVGQIVPYIRTEAETVVFAGDVIPLLANVSPSWISAYDVAPLTSCEERIRMLELAVREKQRLIFCHDAYNVSSLVKKSGSGLFLPVRETIVKESASF